MTNKKFKNANLIINTDYADDCDFYGEKIVAKAADTFGMDDTVALIDLIEECLLDNEGVISIVFHCGRMIVTVRTMWMSSRWGVAVRGIPLCLFPSMMPASMRRIIRLWTKSSPSSLRS